MRIVCISDIHLQTNFELPKGDILVDAGDMTFRGNVKEITEAAEWRRDIKASHGFKHVICIAGNHDWLFENDPGIGKMIMQSNGLDYLQDSEIVVDGIKFYGSPWQPEFCDWAFNLSRMTGELAATWEKIPLDTDVLITHGPPQDILDLCGGWDAVTRRVGCYDLRQRIKVVQPKLHVFGHIHHSYGQVGWADGPTQFVNASICNEGYDPTHAPIVIDI